MHQSCTYDAQALQGSAVLILYRLARPFRLPDRRAPKNAQPTCTHGMLFALQQQCIRGLEGSFRIEHRTGASSAATFWQSHSRGFTEIVLVPHRALFEARCAVVLDEKNENYRFRNLDRLDHLVPSEDGSVTVYIHSEHLHAGTYELALAQRNCAGGERLDRFTICVADPNLPPRQGALALVRAAQLGR